MVYFVVLILVIFSGLFSGLTLGLLGLDRAELQRKISVGNKDAVKIYEVRKNGNLLLCTLLLGNVAVNSALSIFLGSVASGFIAGIVATSLIVLFGEIIPQATCSRYAMQIGAKTTGIVKFFIFLFLPVCWPIAKILDWALGEEMPTIWSRDELKEIIKLHKSDSSSEISASEERIVLGALSYSDKSVSDVMTPRTMVYALEEGDILDKKLLEEIKQSSFTRIPVYEKKLDNIKGILYAKDLIDFKVGLKVKAVYRKNKVIAVDKNDHLDVLMNQLIKDRRHLAFVYNRFGTLVGVVSLEDVVEEVLRVEIIDEDDRVVDLQKEALRRAGLTRR